jgi:hypothetical protein
MKLQRNQVRLKRLTDEDDDYVDASPAERLSFTWELTAELWSIKEPGSPERRLQKARAKLIRDSQTSG